METSSNERDTVRLWRVYHTVNQMLSDRGFLISQATLNISLKDFTNGYASGGIVIDRSVLNFLAQGSKDPDEKIFVFFPEDLSVGVKPIRTYLEKMSEQSVYRAIVIYRNSITPSAAKVMSTMAPKYVLEQFSEAELVVNITEHVLVPQHVLLDDQEKTQILEQYKLKETQLPKILVSDPVARYYGMRRGQVVRIIRSSETAGRYITYRIAV